MNNRNSDVLLVLTSVPDQETAEKIADCLIGERFAACVNIVPGIKSVYRWEDRIHNDDELLLLIKTTVEKYPSLESRLLQLHPYDVPEIVAVNLAGGLETYLKWVRSETEDS